MKSIEDIIRKNRDQFDDAEPLEEHVERFGRKLDRREKKLGKDKMLSFSFFWKVAAAVLILVAVSVVYKQMDNLSLIRTSKSQELPAELLEATSYYAHLNDQKINTIAELSAQIPENEEIIAIAKQEVAVLEQNSQELTDKYIETKDDRVIDAIITNYRVLGELLDHIIQQVKETY